MLWLHKYLFLKVCSYLNAQYHEGKNIYGLKCSNANTSLSPVIV